MEENKLVSQRGVEWNKTSIPSNSKQNVIVPSDCKAKSASETKDNDLLSILVKKLFQQNESTEVNLHLEHETALVECKVNIPSRQGEIVESVAEEEILIDKDYKMKMQFMEYWNDGINLYNESRYQEAIKCNENALHCLEKINGDEYKQHLWAINFNIAVSLTELKQFEEALVFGHRALELCHGENKVTILNTRGWIFSHLGKYKEAVHDFRDSYRLDHNPMTLDVLGRHYLYLKQRKSRFKFYEVLQLNCTATKEQILAAAKKMKLSIKGMANPVAVAEKAHVIFLAERVLLDKDLKEAYDKGEVIMDPKEYFEHAIFYKCEPF